MEGIFENQSKNHSKQTKEVYLKFNKDLDELFIRFDFDGKMYEGKLSGESRKISVLLIDGFECYYKGTVTCIEPDNHATYRVDVSNILSGKDAFCSLIFHYDEVIPLMYGERTNNIKAISKFIAEEMEHSD